jgi:L,D-transpeptidase ErfK/SrfK
VHRAQNRERPCQLERTGPGAPERLRQDTQEAAEPPPMPTDISDNCRQINAVTPSVPRRWEETLLLIYAANMLRTFSLIFASLFAIGTRAQTTSDFTLTGGKTTYEVQAGDSLALVGARFGVDFRFIADQNGLSRFVPLRIGQKLRVDNRHLVPLALTDGIVINIPQRMLFLFKSGALAAAFPISAGRPDWPTPTGKFKVLEKAKDKPWFIPESIREEEKRAEKRIPPGPENPLGAYWIRISPDCGIHGTIRPSSVYQFETHGCIRLRNEDIASLYAQVDLGMPVHIIYEPVLLARVSGAAYLEVHPDVYRLKGSPLRIASQRVEQLGLTNEIDRKLLEEIIRAKSGVARKLNR